MPEFTLRDATNNPNREILQPAWAAGFAALGFRTIGRVLPTEQPTDGLFAMYGTEHEATMRRSATVPTPILVSPDGDAFVEIAEWFGDTPLVYIRSVLANGSLVETRRRWEQPPPPLAPPSRHSVQLTIEGEMLKSHAPRRGRSVEIADGDTAKQVWAAHRRHLDLFSQAQDSAVGAHESLDDFMHLMALAFSHQKKSMAASGRSIKLLWLPLSLTPFVAGNVLAFTGQLHHLNAIGPVGPIAAPLFAVASYIFFFAKIMPKLPFMMAPKPLRPRFRFTPQPA